MALSPWLMSCATIISPIEVLSSDDLGRRRDWSDAEKVRIVEESLQGFRQGSVTARRYGLSRSLLTRWRREYRSGLLSVSASTSFVPLSISPPPAASSEMMAPLQSGGDKMIEIGLPNGRRLTIPASLDPTILARLLPILDVS
nr:MULTISPECIES: transposase [Rhizobium]